MEEHVLLVDSLVVEELMLDEDLIDVHADEEVADEDPVEFEDENVVAIKHEAQVEHFALLRKQLVEEEVARVPDAEDHHVHDLVFRLRQRTEHFHVVLAQTGFQRSACRFFFVEANTFREVTHENKVETQSHDLPNARHGYWTDETLS